MGFQKHSSSSDGQAFKLVQVVTEQKNLKRAEYMVLRCLSDQSSCFIAQFPSPESYFFLRRLPNKARSKIHG